MYRQELSLNWFIINFKHVRPDLPYLISQAYLRKGLYISTTPFQNQRLKVPPLYRKYQDACENDDSSSICVGKLRSLKQDWRET